MLYLLDTNIISYCMKGKYPSIANYMRSIPATDIKIPTIVLAELEFGAHKSTDYERYHSKIMLFTNAFESLDFDEQAALEYGKIRNCLAQKGQVIGANDMLIAAIAVANQAILVTNNVGEFSRIEGLMIEDWTK